MLHRVIALSLVVLALSGVGCSTAPDMEDQALFLRTADTSQMWFERNVDGLRQQMDASAAYIVFPEVGQWGILIGGGQFGRGVVRDANGKQIGWAAINNGSIGLQAGVQGLKMMFVLQDEWTLMQFRANRLSGSVRATAVAGEAGASAASSFDHGVAVYEGAQTGLMLGANIGLDWVRFQPMYGGAVASAEP